MKLTYKIVKTVSVEDQKVVFDRNHNIAVLRKEIGLDNVPYEELHNFKVQLNSPTGRSSTFEVNALEYVDKELAYVEKYIEDFNKNLEESESFDFVSVTFDEKQEAMFRDMIEKSDDFIEWANEDTIKPIEVPVSHGQLNKEMDKKIRYLHSVINGIDYIVAMVMDDSDPSLLNYGKVKYHFTTQSEFTKETGYSESLKACMGRGNNPVTINYFQWVNLVTDLEMPKSGEIEDYSDISKRMDNVMDRIQGINLPAGF